MTDSPREPVPAERRLGKPAQVIKCPNCEELTLFFHPRLHIWRCDECGYQQPE